ncbi:MAG: hypothetical protein C5B48_04585 [Candidatus Rokuibacteriota bacterium]|nr:MAG: hypothetical protein C5B48_04585 [Candidatus Rokubacteria bacterium]
MAQKTQTCGKTQVTYDDDKCEYVCVCSKSCTWEVNCKGGITVSGTGLVRNGSGNGKGTRPGWSVQVNATLGFVAKALEKKWRRPVAVPHGMRNKRVARSVKGSPEEIAKALGLQLGKR